jgi:hypothetical protein
MTTGDDDLDEDELSDDGSADDSTEISCPYCGELVEITLDPGGGAVQEYVEDCQVCCRPMRLVVRYRRGGEAEVSAVAEDEEI